MNKINALFESNKERSYCLSTSVQVAQPSTAPALSSRRWNATAST